MVYCQITHKLSNNLASILVDNNDKTIPKKILSELPISQSPIKLLMQIILRALLHEADQYPMILILLHINQVTPMHSIAAF